MSLLSLLTPTDVQEQLAAAVIARRKAKKWSRQTLAERSSVPASTIKKFEATGQISLRQFILLWQAVDQLENLISLTKETKAMPASINEVLKT
ncbi:helix-turn-helix domain-containing protein [Endozoicomonas numazuensis]|uniref:Transcriptional regulator n=1 Tax=Endozoicomonas numazuensis TaxID=1137799 RepID=A0A081NEZ2_9GAMM|nr:transcriptional regulator [Endozoicomonas numazuensis]KEQ17015.1 transcriptional regulator [Endozoicomonas numazuensis]